VALAESAIAGGIGVRAPDPGDLFGEGEGRVVASAAAADVAALERLAGEAGVPMRRLGEAGGERIVLGRAELSLDEARRLHGEALGRRMDGAAA
jgi:phosphoribosylformylglycinamidine synthase